MRRRHLTPWMLAAAALLARRAAHASPEDLFAFGPRPMAMGGLGGTFADDYAAVHANPASLSRARRGAFALGYVGGTYELSLGRGTAAPERFRVDPVRATLIGATLPLPFGGILRDRVALGVGFYTPTDVVVRGRIQRPETPQFLVVADRAQSVAVQAGVGFDLGRGLRIGAGFAALAAVRGTVQIATDATGRAASRVDNQLVASYAPVVGASWDYGPIRTSLVYRGSLEGRLAVQIDVDTNVTGIALPRLNIAGLAQYDPWQLAFEVAFARGPWTVAAGATYKRWGEYPGLLERTTTRSPEPPPPGFTDTLVLRAGVEHRWTFRESAVALRGGYFYEPSPAPVAAGVANYLDADRHAFTLGLGLSSRVAGSTLSLDVFGQVHVMPARTSAKGPDVPADNPGAPSLTYGGTMLVVGLATSVTF